MERETKTLHAKTMEVDGQLAIVGSMNLNRRSEAHDTEDVVVVENPQIATAMNQRYTSGEKATHLVTAEELKADAIWSRMKSWGAQLLSSTF